VSDPREDVLTGPAKAALPEQRAIASLLRQLPDPEPPEDLAGRVIQRIEAIEARPRVIRGLFGSLSQPRAAAALAAGLAGYLLLVSPAVEPSDSASGRLAARGPDGSSHEVAADDVTQAKRRPASSWVASAAAAPPGQMAFFAGNRPLSAHTIGTTPALPPLDHRLDRQIDQLLHNPEAFFRRFERIHERQRYLARLADRSARRGDSVDVALRVRTAPHPLATRVAEEFLRASLVRSVAQPPRRSESGSPAAPQRVYAH